jgi:HPt (histidine-containing phosphotransfer) domain-containing protein
MRREMLKKMFEDEEFISRYIQVFKMETPKMLKSIHDALKVNDYETISIVSHGLKSQLIYLDDNASTQLAEQIELIADDHSNGNDDDTNRVLCEYFSRLEILINQLIKEL